MKKLIHLLGPVIFLFFVFGLIPMPTQAQLQAPLPNLTGIVKDTNAAIALGKAFFWDQQIGSDLQSCASCHFNAGARHEDPERAEPRVQRHHLRTDR